VKTWIAMKIRIPTSLDLFFTVGSIPMFQEVSDKDVDQLGIELLSLLLLEHGNGVIPGEGTSVRALSGHGVIGVRYGDDPGPWLDFPPLYSIRVSSTVEPLVMVANDGPGRLQERNYSDNPFPFSRVFLYLSVFVLREIPVFVNDEIGDSDLPDIV